jgi:hypothetical protein
MSSRVMSVPIGAIIIPSIDLRASAIDQFGEVAMAPDQEQRFPAGPESTKRSGYDPVEVDGLPGSVTESFCGVGNPFLLGEPQSGQTVLDLGCGAGFDTLLAGQRVGPSGRCPSARI